MNRFQESMRAWNTAWNDIPRRFMWIVVMLSCLLLILLVFPYVAPFMFGALFAWIIEPAVRFVTARLGGGKAVRRFVVAVFVLVVVGAFLVVVLYLSGVAIREIKSLALALPGWAGSASQNIRDWIEGLDLDFGLPEVGIVLEEALVRLLGETSTMVTTLASRVASEVARVAFQAVGMLPQGIVFVVMTIMGTYYMSADKERIISFLLKLLPEKYKQRSSLVRKSFLRAIFTQFRTALIMLGVTFAELSVGFSIMGLEYAILLALLIALLDALPVIGAGLFLLPMLGYGLVVSDMTLAIGSGLIYIMLIIVRQLLEPRLIGRQLGLYPLATMMAMYAGLKVMGFLGMLVGPMMLLLCKVALPVDLVPEVVPEKKSLWNIKKKKKKSK